MRFTTAWAETASQNTVLKCVMAALSLVIVILGISLVRVALKDPIVIERSCFTRGLKVASSERSESEIRAFLEEALKQRFNSDSSQTMYLSKDEEASRKSEQDKLKASQMSQKLIVNQIDIQKSTIKIDSDRLISVGQVRSAFAFPIEVSLTTLPRTEANPYGLVLSRVSPIKEKTGEKE